METDYSEMYKKKPEPPKPTFREYMAEKHPEYVIDKYNTPVFEKLFEKDRKKGIMVIGEIGCGKTELMKMYHEYGSKFEDKGFILASVRKICYEYQKSGIESLDRYLNFHLCIDDLGTELTNINHYGTTEDIISNILYLRYEGHLRTYATTNLNQKMLKDRYGDRLYDRFKEIFTVVHLDGKSRRKGE